MSWAAEAQRAWHDRTSEELARAWVGRIVERTPLDRLEGLDLGWLGREGPELIGQVLSEVNSPPPAGPAALAGAAAKRARSLSRLRPGEAAAGEVVRDLADLQVLIGEALARNGGDGDPLERSGRLAILFGELQAAYVEGLVEGRELAELAEPPAEPGEEQLRAELASAAGERPRAGLALLEIGLDDRGRINIVHGPGAGERLLASVGDALRAAIAGSGNVYARSGEELAALVESSTQGAVDLAHQLRETIELLESEHGISASVSIGVAHWPDHAGEPMELLERVREATYRARAAGEGVAVCNVPSDS